MWKQQDFSLFWYFHVWKRSGIRMWIGTSPFILARLHFLRVSTEILIFRSGTEKPYGANTITFPQSSRNQLHLRSWLNYVTIGIKLTFISTAMHTSCRNRLSDPSVSTAIVKQRNGNKYLQGGSEKLFLGDKRSAEFCFLNVSTGPPHNMFFSVSPLFLISMETRCIIYICLK